jgi:hypothetical protein
MFVPTWSEFVISFLGPRRSIIFRLLLSYYFSPHSMHSVSGSPLSTSTPTYNASICIPLPSGKVMLCTIRHPGQCVHRSNLSSLLPLGAIRSTEERIDAQESLHLSLTLAVPSVLRASPLCVHLARTFISINSFHSIPPSWTFAGSDRVSTRRSWPLQRSSLRPRPLLRIPSTTLPLA